MNLISFGLILVGVLLNAAAQLFLKAGTNALGNLIIDRNHVIKSIFSIVFEIHILSGLLCYVFSVAIWIVALSRTPVSVAYPMLSIGYVVNAIVAKYYLGEDISIQKLIAIGIIILGVFVLAKS